MDAFIQFLSNNAILAVIWLVLFFMLINSLIKAKFSAIRQINPQQLTLLVNKQDATVIDMRSRDDYRKGTIASAVHLMPEKAREKDFAGLEKHKTSPIILVCNTGMTASGTADAMHKAGFEQVYVLSGGIGAWQGANLPLTSGAK